MVYYVDLMDSLLPFNVSYVNYRGANAKRKINDIWIDTHETLPNFIESIEFPESAKDLWDGIVSSAGGYESLKSDSWWAEQFSYGQAGSLDCNIWANL